jgi:hypothetical protein
VRWPLEKNEPQADEQQMSEQQLYLKSHVSGKEVLIAVCDCDLMGKKFVEGHLHVEILSDFFGEEKATVKDVEQALGGATMANLIGEVAVGHAIRLGYVARENVLIIDGVPCAQMVLM